MSYIEVEQMAMTYKSGREVFNEVRATFEQGTLTFLTGATGSGKSTFLNLLLATLKPTAGTITVESVDIHKLRVEQLARYRRNVGFVFQQHLLLGKRTLFENVAMPLWAQGLRKKAVERRVAQCLEGMQLSEFSKKYPVTLSNGEQQRGAIARAIVNKPKLLFADEPTGNLDQALGFEVMQLFRKYAEEGGTVLVATHDARYFQKGDRILRLINRTMSELIV